MGVALGVAHLKVILVILVVTTVSTSIVQPKQKYILHCDEESNFPPSTQCTYSNLKGNRSTNWVYKHGSETICTNFLRPPDVIFISILNSNIDEIPTDLFKTYGNATTFNAPENNIKGIRLYNFENGKKLQAINLPWNKLIAIPNMAFVETPKLITLDLSHNQIELVEEQAFYKLSLLRSLDLSFNKIGTVDTNTLKGLPNLEILLLNNNKLTTIPDGFFENNHYLKDLDISKNFIQELSGQAFANIVDLCFLNLASNKLRTFDPNIAVMNKLVLSNNQLKSLIVRQNVRQIEARNNQIKTIKCADGMEITQIDLRNNSLTEVGCLSEMEELTWFDLSFNKLKPLKGNEFEKLVKLDDLELANTTLKQYPLSSFKNQRNITHVNIANNRMREFDPKILIDNKEVTHLYLEGNDLDDLDFQQLRQYLPKLSVLGIARNSFNCSYLKRFLLETKNAGVKMYLRFPLYNTTNINGIACTGSFDDQAVGSEIIQAKPLSDVVKRSINFDHTSGLLEIKTTNLDELPEDLFLHYPNASYLKAIDIGIKMLKRSSFRGAKKLCKIDLSKNSITRLSNTIFSEAPELTSLSLADNPIEEIESQAFYGIPKLQTLEIPRGRVRRAAPSYFEPLPELEEVNLEQNTLWSIEDDLFDQNPKLKKVTMANNMIELITGRPFRNVENLETLDLNGNKIDDFTTDGLRVNRLNIKENNIKKLYHTGNVTILDAQNNDIETVISPTNYDTVEVYLRNNSLRDLTGVSMLRGMKVLDVSQNKIDMMIPADFKYLENLQFLNLSGNQIPYLGLSQFLSQKNLSSIDLSNNKLQQIDMAVFSPLVKITQLNLAGNKLTKLTNLAQIMDKMDENTEIDISGNPWQCSHLEEIMSQLITRKVKILCGSGSDTSLDGSVGGILCEKTSGWTASVSKDFKCHKKISNTITIFNRTITDENQQSARLQIDLNVSGPEGEIDSDSSASEIVMQRKLISSGDISSKMSKNTSTTHTIIETEDVPDAASNQIFNFLINKSKLSGNVTKTTTIRNFTTVIQKHEGHEEPTIIQNTISSKPEKLSQSFYETVVEDGQKPDKFLEYFWQQVGRQEPSKVTKIIKNYTIYEEEPEIIEGIHQQPQVSTITRTKTLKNVTTVVEETDDGDNNIPYTIQRVVQQPEPSRITKITKTIRNYTQVIEEDGGSEEPAQRIVQISQEPARTQQRKIIRNFTQIIEDGDGQAQPSQVIRTVIQQPEPVERRTITKIIRNYTQIVEDGDENEPQVNYIRIPQPSPVSTRKVIKNFTQIIEDGGEETPQLVRTVIKQPEPVERRTITKIVRNYTQVIEDSGEETPQVVRTVIQKPEPVERRTITKIIRNYTQVIEDGDENEPQVNIIRVEQPSPVSTRKVIKNFTQIIEDGGEETPQVTRTIIKQPEPVERHKTINYTYFEEEEPQTPFERQISQNLISESAAQDRTITQNFTQIIEEDMDNEIPSEINEEQIQGRTNRRKMFRNITYTITENEDDDTPQARPIIQMIQQPIVQRKITKTIKNYTQVIEEDGDTNEYSPEIVETVREPSKTQRTKIIRNFTQIIEDGGEDTPQIVQTIVKQPEPVERRTITKIIRNYTQIVEDGDENEPQVNVVRIPQPSPVSTRKVIKNFTQIVEDGGDERPQIIQTIVKQPEPVERRTITKIIRNYTQVIEDDNEPQVNIIRVEQPTPVSTRKIIKNFTQIIEDGGEETPQIIRTVIKQPEPVERRTITKIVRNYTQVIEDGGEETPQVISTVIQQPEPVERRTITKIIRNYTQVIEDEDEGQPIIKTLPLPTTSKVIKNTTTIIQTGREDKPVQPIKYTIIPAEKETDQSSTKIENLTYFEEEPKIQSERQVIITNPTQQNRTVIIKNVTQIIEEDNQPVQIVTEVTRKPATGRSGGVSRKLTKNITQITSETDSQTPKRTIAAMKIVQPADVVSNTKITNSSNIVIEESTKQRTPVTVVDYVTGQKLTTTKPLASEFSNEVGGLSQEDASLLKLVQWNETVMITDNEKPKPIGCASSEDGCCPNCCDEVKTEIVALKERYHSLQIEIKQLKAETLKETTSIVDSKVQGMKDYFTQMILEIMQNQ